MSTERNKALVRQMYGEFDRGHTTSYAHGPDPRWQDSGTPKHRGHDDLMQQLGAVPSPEHGGS